MSSAAWASLGLSPWLGETCIEMGLKRPTPIQEACIPPALQGHDVLGSAETGSGKTAAFALPILQALSEDPYGVFAVVLSPARELAAQIADQFSALGTRMSVRVSLIVGGVDMMRQALELSKRPHIVIGTPGRLADHLRSSGSAAVMRNARFLVIDEADRLLELGFADDLGAIISQMPARRQTLLFSATMSGALQRLQRLALTSPHVADLAPSERVPAALALDYVFVPSNVRDLYLVHLVRRFRDKGETIIIFTSTCRACEMLACTLRALAIDCAPLHSQQAQAKRLAAIGRFKQGTLAILVATDVAARGIDIPQVGVVINHNVPAMPRDFVHRCGRTARAGRVGCALTIVSQYDVEVLLAIEAHIGRKLASLDNVEESEVLSALNEVASARRTAVLELTENGFLEREKERKKRRKEDRLQDEQEGDEEGELEGVDAPEEARGSEERDPEQAAPEDERGGGGHGHRRGAPASAKGQMIGAATLGKGASADQRKLPRPSSNRPAENGLGEVAWIDDTGTIGGSGGKSKKRKKELLGATRPG